MTFQELNIDTRGRASGTIKTKCPKCYDKRSHPDLSLSVNLNEGLWNCHYCHWSGRLDKSDREWVKYGIEKKIYKKPIVPQNIAISENAKKWFLSRGISAETLFKMQITDSLEYMPQTQRKQNAIQFKFFKNGELVNIKYRTGDKLFKLTQGAELLPYNIDAIKAEKECIITEGEIDALSFIECGYKNTISVPNGANKNLTYLDDYIESYFEDKDVIYIAVDTDTKGLELKDELIRRFGAEKCKIITYGADYKDINEVLVAKGKQGVKDCYERALEVPVDGIFSVSDFESDLDLLFEKGLQKGVVVGHSNFDELVSFETRRLCLVTGIPTMGKSEFLDEIVVRLNLKYGWRTAFFSPENMPISYHTSKIISKLVGKGFGKEKMPYNEYQQAKQYVEREFAWISPENDFSLSNILEKAKVLIRRRGIKILVLDPYNRIENEQGNNTETKYISELLDKITNFAKINDILVFLVAHPIKMGKGADGKFIVPSLYDIAGSAHFFNKTDFGIIVHREDSEKIVSVHVQKVKFKHLGQQGQAIFKYNINNGRYLPYYGNEVIEWDNSNYIATNNLNNQIEANEKALLPLEPINAPFPNNVNFDIQVNKPFHEPESWFEEDENSAF